jgi:hypothetical protein
MRRVAKELSNHENKKISHESQTLIVQLLQNSKKSREVLLENIGIKN